MTKREESKTSTHRAGDPVYWRWMPRGGYGYIQRVPAVVVEVREKVVGIAAQRGDGTWEPRWVRPRNLVPREW